MWTFLKIIYDNIHVPNCWIKLVDKTARFESNEERAVWANWRNKGWSTVSSKKQQTTKNLENLSRDKRNHHFLQQLMVQLSYQSINHLFHRKGSLHWKSFLQVKGGLQIFCEFSPKLSLLSICSPSGECRHYWFPWEPKGAPASTVRGNIKYKSGS